MSSTFQMDAVAREIGKLLEKVLHNKIEKQANFISWEDGQHVFKFRFLNAEAFGMDLEVKARPQEFENFNNIRTVVDHFLKSAISHLPYNDRKEREKIWRIK